MNPENGSRGEARLESFNSLASAFHRLTLDWCVCGTWLGLTLEWCGVFALSCLGHRVHLQEAWGHEAKIFGFLFGWLQVTLVLLGAAVDSHELHGSIVRGHDGIFLCSKCLHKANGFAAIAAEEFVGSGEARRT